MSSQQSSIEASSSLAGAPGSLPSITRSKSDFNDFEQALIDCSVSDLSSLGFESSRLNRADYRRLVEILTENAQEHPLSFPSRSSIDTDLVSYSGDQSICMALHGALLTRVEREDFLNIRRAALEATIEQSHSNLDRALRAIHAYGLNKTEREELAPLVMQQTYSVYEPVTYRNWLRSFGLKSEEHEAQLDEMRRSLKEDDLSLREVADILEAAPTLAKEPKSGLDAWERLIAAIASAEEVQVFYDDQVVPPRKIVHGPKGIDYRQLARLSRLLDKLYMPKENVEATMEYALGYALHDHRGYFDIEKTRKCLKVAKRWGLAHVADSEASKELAASLLNNQLRNWTEMRADGPIENKQIARGIAKLIRFFLSKFDVKDKVSDRKALRRFKLSPAKDTVEEFLKALLSP